MWKITEQVRVNGHLEKKYTIVDCTQEELDNKIIPVLSKLIKVRNKHAHQLYNTNTTIEYVISPIYWEDADDLHDQLIANLKDHIGKYNRDVISRNKVIKLCNRRSNRPIDEGLLSLIEEKDYINPFNDSNKIEIDGNTIIIK